MIWSIFFIKQTLENGDGITSRFAALSWTPCQELQLNLHNPGNDEKLIKSLEGCLSAALASVSRHMMGMRRGEITPSQLLNSEGSLLGH